MFLWSKCDYTIRIQLNEFVIRLSGWQLIRFNHDEPFLRISITNAIWLCTFPVGNLIRCNMCIMRVAISSATQIMCSDFQIYTNFLAIKCTLDNRNDRLAVASSKTRLRRWETLRYHPHLSGFEFALVIMGAQSTDSDHIHIPSVEIQFIQSLTLRSIVVLAL